MKIDELVDRVSSLPLTLLRVLALRAEGLSNGQIAAKLGYNNRRVVATYVSLINKELELTKIQSDHEKRHLAVEAFRKSRPEPVKVQVSISSRATIASNTISISRKATGRIRSLIEKGYKIDAVELIRPNPGVARRTRRTQAAERG
jgi:transcriptional regulator